MLSENKLSALNVPFPSGGILKLEGDFPFVFIEDDIRKKLLNSLITHDPLLRSDPALLARVCLPRPPHGELQDVGAHVSVIDLQEEGLIPPDTLDAFIRQNKNTPIAFDKVLGVKKLDPTEKWEHLWILELESSQLEDLREKNLGLSRKPNFDQFNFHLSIAEVPRQIKKTSNSPFR